jgi:hypothetical protein
MRTTEKESGHRHRPERDHFQASPVHASSEVTRAKRFTGGLWEHHLPPRRKLTDRSNPSAIRQHLTRLKSIQLTV